MSTHYPEEHVGGIPVFSVREWQLYPGMQGVGRAAFELNQALFQARLYLQDNLPGETEKAVINTHVETSFTHYMLPVMRTYARFGANDTEPRQFVQQNLSDTARLVLGKSEKELSFKNLW